MGGPARRAVNNFAAVIEFRGPLKGPEKGGVRKNPQVPDKGGAGFTVLSPEDGVFHCETNRRNVKEGEGRDGSKQHGIVHVGRACHGRPCSDPRRLGPRILPAGPVRFSPEWPNPVFSGNRGAGSRRSRLRS